MRDYDPTTGRYLQAGPLGLIDGASVYGYARQSPMAYTDPTGQCPWCVYVGAEIALSVAIGVAYELTLGDGCYSATDLAYDVGLGLIGAPLFKGASSILMRGGDNVALGLIRNSKPFNREAIKRGFQDHHIISDKNALTKNHALLRLAGFNLQSRTNRIFLPPNASLHPTRSIHIGRHRTSVNRNLARQMDDIVNMGRQNGFTQQQYNDALRGVIAGERSLLRSGRRALNKRHRPGAF